MTNNNTTNETSDDQVTPEEISRLALKMYIEEYI